MQKRLKVIFAMVMSDINAKIGVDDILLRHLIENGERFVDFHSFLHLWLLLEYRACHQVSSVSTDWKYASS